MWFNFNSDNFSSLSSANVLMQSVKPADPGLIIFHQPGSSPHWQPLFLLIRGEAPRRQPTLLSLLTWLMDCTFTSVECWEDWKLQVSPHHYLYSSQTFTSLLERLTFIGGVKSKPGNVLYFSQLTGSRLLSSLWLLSYSCHPGPTVPVYLLYWHNWAWPSLVATILVHGNGRIHRYRPSRLIFLCSIPILL